MEEGANGPQGPRFYGDFTVAANHFSAPPPQAETVITSANPDPALEGWMNVENRCMLHGEADAPPTSLVKTLGSTAGATAAAVRRETTRNARWIMSVTGSVVDACETGLGCPGFTGTVGTVSYYSGALVAATVLHYCGFTAADPQEVAKEAEEPEDTVPPA